MRKKFNKTLTFDSQHGPVLSVASEQSGGGGGVSESRRRISMDRANARAPMDEKPAYQTVQRATAPQTNYHKKLRLLEPLSSHMPSDYANKPGLAGTFAPIKNDFTVFLGAGAGASESGVEQTTSPSEYRDERHWTRETKEQVKRVRFLICTLALFGLALGLMSRLILNVSIVEMVKRPEMVPSADDSSAHDELPAAAAAAATTLAPHHHHHLFVPPDQSQSSTTVEPAALSLDPLIWAATHEPGAGEALRTSAATTSAPRLAGDFPATTRASSGGGGESPPPAHANSTISLLQEDDGEEQQQNDGLHFDWSKQEINVVLGSFYMGYAPGILFSGGLAQRYGAKWPMFVCVFGSALINVLTPLVARTSLTLLITSRVTLGLIQGSLMPCLYELFNRWLTATESSLFAPLIKVSMPLGSLMGTMMPGILASLRLDWPNLFYIGGALCLVWSLAWVALASSLPQESSLVGVHELARIMRKKQPAVRQVATITDKSSSPARRPSKSSKSNGAGGGRGGGGTPWLLIVTNPSVLALTVVKFTYNIGMDFIFLQVAVYLREVHNAPMETISAIASTGYCMQMLLIAFVGWLAKVVVLKRACGLSVTKWRKLFQGGSNLLMALTYLALAYLAPELNTAAALLLAVCFFWMLGAGGESMVPYDLSSEYPASIVGFAHSMSIFSGVALTAVCDLVLGENTEDPASWSVLFYLLAGALALGGLVFVLVLKAKPFLPGEKVPKQQVSSISRPAPTQQQQQTKQLNGFR